MAKAKNRLCGIYGIYCTSNEMLYVGKSKHILLRFRAHESDLMSGTHCNSFLQAAWTKYGDTSFLWFVIELLESPMLDQAEIAHIAYMKTTAPSGFNLSLGGDGCSGHCDITRKKMSRSRSGANHHYWGKERTEATKRKISAALSGEKSPRWGVKMTADEVAALQRSRRAAGVSEETKQKLREAWQRNPHRKTNQGRTWSAEVMAKMSAARKTHSGPNKGKKFSAEYRAKMSASRKAYFARKRQAV